MSILKTHNLQSPDSSSVNITLAPNAGMVVTGISTFSAPLVVSSSENTLGILTSTDDGANLDLFDNDTQSRIRTVDGQLQLRADVGNAVADSSIRFFVDGGVERLRVNSNGKLLIGSDTIRNIGGQSASGHIQLEGITANTSSVALINNQANTNSPVLSFGKTRGTSTGAVTTVADGDILGSIKFCGADGTDIENSTANIKAIVNGTVAGNQIPTDLVFETSPTGSSGRTERLRIKSDGKVGINSSAPEAGFDLKHNDGMFLKSVSNANGIKLRFSDNSAYDQVGTIEYKHSDNAIVDGASEAFVIKGTESRTAVQIEGRLTVTQQPCASVYQCTGPSGNAVTSDAQDLDPLHFDHIDIQQGNMTISNNNARITVPIAGIYLVTFMVSGTCTTSDNDDGIELNLLKNGNEYPATNGRAEAMFNFGSVSNQSEFFCSNHLYVNCAKDDYLEIALSNIDGSNANVNRGNFGVMLMG